MFSNAAHVHHITCSASCTLSRLRAAPRLRDPGGTTSSATRMASWRGVLSDRQASGVAVTATSSHHQSGARTTRRLVWSIAIAAVGVRLLCMCRCPTSVLSVRSRLACVGSVTGSPQTCCPSQTAATGSATMPRPSPRPFARAGTRSAVVACS
jgi:hypothetical protein